MSINKVILVGNVGKDPVVRYFDKGVAKASFPLATSETYTNQQGEVITSTEWHNIVLWRALAEVAEKTIKKGSQVYIVGKIKTRSYVDKDGVNKYITEILADTLLPLEKKKGSGTQPYGSGQSRVEAPEKSSKETAINEPTSKYHSVNEPDNPDLTDKGGVSDDDSGLESQSGGSQNDDDLPF